MVVALFFCDLSNGTIVGAPLLVMVVSQISGTVLGTVVSPPEETVISLVPWTFPSGFPDVSLPSCIPPLVI